MNNVIDFTNVIEQDLLKKIFFIHSIDKSKTHLTLCHKVNETFEMCFNFYSGWYTND